MPITTVPLADRTHSAITQIRLTEPEKLLRDGRIIHVLSHLTTCCTGGKAAWELVFTSVPAAAGTEMDARLFTHVSVPAAQKGTLPELAARIEKNLLTLLADSDVAAVIPDGSLPALREKQLITLLRQGGGLIGVQALLTEGHLRQHLCIRPGNGMSLLLVQSGWAEGELEQFTFGETPARRAMLAQEPVFDFALTLWGPDAAENAAWLKGLTLSHLADCTATLPAAYPVFLRYDPWQLMRLLPAAAPRPTLLTLSELLTLCGCPVSLPESRPLPENALRYMGLQADSDLETKLEMPPEMCEMLRMCVTILNMLGVFDPHQDAAPAPALQATLLLPSVAGIYEQFVRLCCYQTMYCPYISFVTAREPAQVTSVYLSVYDRGPGPAGYLRTALPAGGTEAQIQEIILEQMTADFADQATIGPRRATIAYWGTLFDDMATARRQRNRLTHETRATDAAAFARAFLQDRPNFPSLLRRLLWCRHIATNFPAC